MRAPQAVADTNRPQFRVRPARRGDADALAALLVELGYPGATDQATVHWVISHPEIEVIVAGDSSDRAIGMISFSHRPQLRARGRIARIEELVVTESWRRRGVGRELVKKVVERARVLSVKQLELVTHAGGAAPRGFFEACGFAVSDSALLRLSSLDGAR